MLNMARRYSAVLTVHPIIFFIEAGNQSHTNTLEILRIFSKSSPIIYRIDLKICWLLIKIKIFFGLVDCHIKNGIRQQEQ
jgi:hypothetical protein